MRQTLHIFRKDVRHCWPYIAAALALTAANAWQESRELPNPAQVVNMYRPVLLILAWWLAIGAAVHGESLVGDRQFWVTRPYSWKNLLGAKLLFVALFLGLPMFFSDCVIVLASGFNPLPLIPGLLWRQVLLAGFLGFPFAVAALTRVTATFVLAGLAFYVVFTAIAIPIAFHFVYGPPVSHLGTPPWVWDAASWLITAAVCSLVVWQYARRRTAQVRVLAIVLGLLAPVSTTPALYSRLPGKYPSPWQEDPRYRSIAVQFAPGPEEPEPAGIPGRSAGEIRIPVRLSGWPRQLLTYHGCTVNLPQAWVAVGADMTAGSDGRDWVVFHLDDLVRRAVPAEVPLRLSFTLNVDEPYASVNLRPAGGWSSIPGFGNVALPNDAHGTSYLIWRTALTPAEPGWKYTLSNADFRIVRNGEWSGMFAYSQGSVPLQFHFTPIYSYPGNVTLDSLPAVLTVNRASATIHRQLQLPPIRLADYEIRQP
jgi:hypothetical protein